ncbi:uncharacterized protein ColSpa_09673 [Colletotrichum spaethianum]|uniref:Fungal N-terminal domain-containing protein n=1 Tax=Colletotrichum spaethianum TaxID=700344 RepID=A0AA37PC49_9PEZI|nr:uncharacterized protein ColSpa_09673 [Colletotrichum spaethianum]GKT49492.1 hypothetical protein ColSpa_09673 [Colletotrichum spaethianum]
MAEVLGVVASAIAVGQATGQAAKSVLKLKQLWDQIENAPQRFDDLLSKLEILDALLKDVDRQFAEPSLPAGFWDRSLAQQTFKLCRSVSTQLESLCITLNDQIRSPKKSKRVRGAIKVVVDDDYLKALEAKLESAFSLLQMAHQCYLG